MYICYYLYEALKFVSKSLLEIKTAETLRSDEIQRWINDIAVLVL